MEVDNIYDLYQSRQNFKAKNIKSTREKREHDSFYSTFTERNIGILSLEEQEIIRSSHIGVLGTGGIGAPLALTLAHAGIEHFTLLDRDIVELSNLNRQPYEFSQVGQFKADLLAEKIKRINPYCEIRVFHEVSLNSISRILDGVDLVILSLDGPAASVLIARECRSRNIPMVEAWATPIIFTRWFTRDSKDYETTYHLPTRDMTIEEVYADPNIKKVITSKFIEQMLKLPHIVEDYTHEQSMFDKMMRGEVPLRSFAPNVWLVSTYTAHDVIFAGLLNRKERVLAPTIRGFDPMRMRLVELKE